MNTGRRALLHVAADVMAPSALALAQSEWDALADRVVAAPYLRWGWLQAWIDVYAPHRLLRVRITDSDDELVALGLIEKCRFGVLRFAGAPVTPVRGLLCDPRDEGAAWLAVDEWVRSRTDWTLLSGIAAGTCAVPGALRTPVPWYGLDLPDTFEEFLRTREPSRRREFRRRLRVADREGVLTRSVTGPEACDGVEAFARLHTARAQSKGERHRVIDERLVRMLCQVADRRTPELRAFVIEQKGMTIAAAVQLDNGPETWAYNTGFDPGAANVSPGLVLRLASIEDAIGRGVGRLDLGPGDFAYKGDFGGTPFSRVKIDMSKRGLTGRLMRERIRAEHRLRSAPLLRNGVMHWRALRAARHARGTRSGHL